MTVALSEVGAEPAPFRWTAERTLALVECGVIEEGRGVELIDGAILTDPPQGAAHFCVFMALQGLFGGMGLVSKGLMVGPTLVVSDHDVFDPEFALLRPGYDPRHLPRATDVALVIEVAVSSRRIDLGPKKAAYAKAGVPATGSSTRRRAACGCSPTRRTGCTAGSASSRRARWSPSRCSARCWRLVRFFRLCSR